MRIDFRVDGGLAAFPGLAKPVTIHCDALPAGENAHIRDLVRRADFFTRPEQDQRAPQLPDTRSYTIAIDDGPRCRTVTLREPIADPSLRDLVDTLHDKALAVRRTR
jgi:Emfourin